MTVVFLPVERFWPLHPDQKTFRPQWTTDLFYFVATHLPAQLITLGDGRSRPATRPGGWRFHGWRTRSGACRFSSSCRWRLSSRISRSTPRTGPFTRIPFLWRFHAIHHSIETMDWVAGSRSHYVDILLTRGLILIPMTLFGFSQATLAGYLVFVSFHATFCHTDFRPRTIWLEPYFVTVRYHHWHHAADPERGGCQLRHPPPVHRSLVRNPLSSERRLAAALRPGRRLGAARLLRAIARAVQARRA